MARPPIYKQKIADEICERLAKGETLRSICRDEHMPSRPTVHEWIIKDVESFSSHYVRARAAGMDEIADGTRDIAYDGRNDTYRDDEGRVRVDYDVVARSKLRVENDWKYLAKMDKRYHDKTTHEMTGADGAPLFGEDERVRRVAALRATVAKRIAQNNEPDNADDLA